MDVGCQHARLLPFFAAGALLCATAAPLLAADVSPWDEDIRSAARLIGAADAATGRVRAGIEIKLKPGWKTYWRYPGDSGVPPATDFSGSENVKSVAVLFPAPSRFSDGGGGYSIGYTGDLVWPLRVVAQDPAKPATLRVHLDYAVCEKLCVPAKASLELRLAGASGTQDTVLNAAQARVPKPAKIGEGGALSIRAAHRDDAAGKSRIVVDVAAPEGAGVDLFAEGPNAEWALPLPEKIPGAPAGLTRFAFALDGLPPGGKPDGATLRLTGVAAGAAVEVPLHLD
jgi:DsbC/DsbD-like thiol-disulfide interchange protein